MRVLLTTHAVHSHLYNLVPIAWALRTAGHEVCVATHPNFLETAKSTGITTVPVGEELAAPRDLPAAPGAPAGSGTPFGFGYDMAETRPEVLTPAYVRGTLATYTSRMCEYLSNQSMLDDLVEFARAWKPDLVVWDAHHYAGPVLARAVGAAHARILAAPDHWARMHSLLPAPAPGQSAAPGDDPLADYLGGKLAPYGAEFDQEMVIGQATIDPLPSFLRVPLPNGHLPMRHVPFNGPATIPAWLRRKPRRPRVCLTLGMTRRASGVEQRAGNAFPFATVLEQLAGLDVEVVATLSADQVPPGTSIPENVRIFDYLPLNALLPTCAAIVHYGGMGTVGVAAVHGVPQLSIPGNIWGEGVVMRQWAEQGAGLVADADTLVERLGRLIDDPSFAAGAERIQKEMLAAPSPHDLVPALEELTERHRGSRTDAA
ncbi:activator-dependent family glycosyltransferase [Streptomyces ardesiacus]|uniref:activator-dependent family glycosyltransferase n=1 Tax=Streptomyces ardesiacus TaxID=285564 RepID=UPI0038150F5D